MAPHAALAEIGAPYELVLVERETAQGDAAYRALNPSGLVPTLEDGDLVLTESAGILLHLADRFPASRLVPAEPSPERSLTLTRLVHLTNTLQPALLHHLYPERYGDAGVGERAAAALAEEFDRLDTDLAGRAWLVGEERSAADLFLFMLTRWGRTLDPPAWERPHLRAHVVRTLGLPGVARMMREQGLELPPFAQV